MSLKCYNIVDLFPMSFIETRNNAKLDIYIMDNKFVFVIRKLIM